VTKYRTEAEKALTAKQAAQNRYRAKNRTALKAKDKAYRLKNREKLAQKAREHRAEQRITVTLLQQRIKELESKLNLEVV
jgi:hypothetical protein